MDQGESIKAEEGKTSILAVITFVTSIGTIPLIVLSFYFYIFFILCLILPLITLVLGIAALINIASSDRKLEGKEFAIMGMVLSIVLGSFYWIILMRIATFYGSGM